MSCRALHAQTALRVCTDALLAREEFSKEYSWLEALKANDRACVSLKQYFNRTFDFEQYSLKTDSWEPRSKEVDILGLLTTRKLNHEEEDFCTKLLLEAANKLSERKSRDLRLLASLMAVLNSRELLLHIRDSTAGLPSVSIAKIFQLVKAYEGECFTSSFDVRTFNLAAAEKQSRKLKRMATVLRTESKNAVNLKEPHRRSYVIKRRLAYGTLLGKNAYANLTMIVKTKGMLREPGVLPGPGAESGLRFVTGGSLGCGVLPTCQGLLANMYDAAVKDYKSLRTRWKAISDEYQALAEAATTCLEENVLEMSSCPS